METKRELSCDELKRQVITAVENADCDSEFILGIKNYLNIFFNDPVPVDLFDEAKKLLNDECHNAQVAFKDSFLISKNWLNRIIGENWDKEFMHIFFIDDDGELSIVFRFSDTETFRSTVGQDINLDLNKESAYLLKNGQVIQFDRLSSDFSSLTAAYKQGIGNRISTIQNSMLTEYITYSMKKIFLFNGFEHDITLELGCVVDSMNKKNRITLFTYVNDKDRIHHINQTYAKVYEGYYDLGNLKP
ncbi:hypothetical protein [uncultured Chryseobacterium sp.]|uniref:hypothetical protein n=1 Tax=uncultured Chryseobacterium sp. TaxID=259322 RepID=UPI0025E1AC3A|nr:hypothetical protein [uncultured Chryseobacterium sp.]